MSSTDPFLDIGQWLVANVSNILATMTYVRARVIHVLADKTLRHS